MTLNDVVMTLQAEPLCVSGTCGQRDFEYAFACDLMSDVLAMVQKETEKVILLTGLANSQVMHTAEMLDVSAIILVRGKRLNQQDTVLAQEKGISVYTTSKTMYESCGLLFQEGLHSVPIL